MNIKIRNEITTDFKVVENITREAFWNLYDLGCNEHFIVHNIRNHKDYIAELSFVIELDEVIIGSIFYTHSKVISKDNTEFKTISFGPVSILPQFQRKGFGAMIISHSIEVAKSLGYHAIIIGGYPYHYKTYGFVGAKKYNISLPDENYYTGILALPLYDGALDNVSGSIYFSQALEPNEVDVEEFDKTFPFKEKFYQASQTEFENAISEIDTQTYS